MTPLGIVRIVLYVLAAIFSLVVLGLSANLLSLTFQVENLYDYDKGAYYVWDVLALAVSIISLVVLIPVLVIDRVRTNAFTAWTAVELSWLGVLWVLWLAVGSDIASLYPDLVCDGVSYCMQLQGIEALAWLNWLLLLAAFIYVLVVGIMANSAGHTHIWRSSAAEFDMSTVDAGTGAGKGTAGHPIAMNQYGQHGPPTAGQTAYAPPVQSGYGGTALGTTYSGTGYSGTPDPVGGYQGTAQV